MDETKKPAADGVAEPGAEFDVETIDWSIALERLDEHRRTGAGTMSIEEFGAELRRQIALRRAAKA